MRYLVDTGVLLRLFEQSDPQHETIRTLFRQLTARGNELHTTAQNVAEFWNVSTRPSSARGGYGQDVALTDRRVSFLESVGNVLSDHPDAYAEWRRLVVQHQITGVSVHDARLVAVMQATSIKTIITLNTRDFSRYSHVTALTPEQALAQLSKG